MAAGPCAACIAPGLCASSLSERIAPLCSCAVWLPPSSALAVSCADMSGGGACAAGAAARWPAAWAAAWPARNGVSCALLSDGGTLERPAPGAEALLVPGTSAAAPIGALARPGSEPNGRFGGRPTALRGVAWPAPGDGAGRRRLWSPALAAASAPARWCACGALAAGAGCAAAACAGGA